MQRKHIIWEDYVKMSSLPTLAGSPLNLIAIRDQEKNRIKEQLTQIEGEKCVVIDTQINKQLIFVTEGSTILKECGVTQFIALSGTVGTFSEPNIVFFIRPTPEDIKMTANYILKLVEMESAAKRTIFFFPRITRLVREMMKDEGILELASIVSTDLDIYPMDDDILVLGIPDCYADLYLYNDFTCLQLTANALTVIQQLYGVIPNITAVGPHAQAIVDMMIQSRSEGVLKEVDLPPEIDRLIVLDRSVDLVSTFVTPLTYEGMLDEVLGIERGAVTVSEKVLEGKSDKPVTIRLNNTDVFFQEMRDYNVVKVARVLAEKVSQVNEEMKARPQSGNVSMTEFMEFQHKLPDLLNRKQLSQTHYGLFNAVSKVSNSDDFRQRWQDEHSVLSGDGNPMTLIEMADLGVPFGTVMKLLILYSLVNNGLKPKIFDEIRHSLIQVYGFEKLLLLHNLQKLGLFIPKESGGNFATIRSRMRLEQDGITGIEMNDMSYVTSGYAPLTGRLVQAVLLQGSVSQEIQKLLPVAVHESHQEVSSTMHDTGMKKKIALVVFVGGLTYMEMAAIRQLRHVEECGYEVVMMTTDITSGSRMLKSLSRDLPTIPISQTQ